MGTYTPRLSMLLSMRRREWSTVRPWAACAGLGVGQLDVRGHVVGGEVDGPGPPGGGEAASGWMWVMVQWSRLRTISPRSVTQQPVVVAGGDLVADLAAGTRRR